MHESAAPSAGPDTTAPAQATDRSLQRPPSAHGRASLWLLAGVLVSAAGAGWWWTAHRQEASTAAAPTAAFNSGRGGPGGRRFGPGNAAQPVAVETVRQQDLHLTVEAIGSLTASNTAVVRSQVTGVVQTLNFKEGQQVRAGQVLAQIDPRSFQATLSQAEGTLARDQAQLEGARLDLARYRDLVAKDAGPKQQLDTQVALVGQLEGTVKADQGTVANARLQLSYTSVTAPIPGRVGLRQIDLGNAATPSDPNGIVSITQTRPIALVFAVPASHASELSARLRANENIPVQAWDRVGKQLLSEGRVAAVDNAIDPSTDTLKIKALFPNADDALFPNQAVNVRLQLGTLNQALAVPQAAVLRGSQGFYVYVVNADNTVAVRVIKPGPVDAGWMAVEGALQPGDRVVIDGTDRLREGAKVEVIAADAAQRAGAAAPAGGGRRRYHGAESADASASAPAPGSASGSASGSAPTTAPASGSGSGSGWRSAPGPVSAPGSDPGARPAPAARFAPPTGAAPSQGPGPGPAPAPTAAPDAAAPGAAAAPAERPRWMDRLSPEQQEKVKAMSPEERRAWFREQREMRERNAAQ